MGNGIWSWVAMGLIVAMATRWTTDVWLFSGFPPAVFVRRWIKWIHPELFLVCRMCVGQWIAWTWLILLHLSRTEWHQPSPEDWVAIFLVGLAAQSLALEWPNSTLFRPDPDTDPDDPPEFT